jgi:hypothetical protein
MGDFVTYELAVKLKEKMFPQHITDDVYITDNYGEEEYGIGDRLPIPLVPDYMDDVAAPEIYQVLKWLREEHHLHFEVVSASYGYYLVISGTPDKGGDDIYYTRGPNDAGAWDNYKDCVMYGIEYVIDNLI